MLHHTAITEHSLLFLPRLPHVTACFKDSPQMDSATRKACHPPKCSTSNIVECEAAIRHAAYAGHKGGKGAYNGHESCKDHLQNSWDDRLLRSCAVPCLMPTCFFQLLEHCWVIEIARVKHRLIWVLFRLHHEMHRALSLLPRNKKNRALSLLPRRTQQLRETRETGEN